MSVPGDKAHMVGQLPVHDDFNVRYRRWKSDLFDLNGKVIAFAKDVPVSGDVLFEFNHHPIARGGGELVVMKNAPFFVT